MLYSLACLGDVNNWCYWSLNLCNSPGLVLFVSQLNIKTTFMSKRSKPPVEQEGFSLYISSKNDVWKIGNVLEFNFLQSQLVSATVTNGCYLQSTKRIHELRMLYRVVGYYDPDRPELSN